jgi:hypothetical protein
MFLCNLFSMLGPLPFTYEKKLNLGVKGEGAEVGEEVAGGAVEVTPAHVRRHPHLILQVEEKNKNQSINAVEVAPAHVRCHPHLILQVEEKK